MRSFNADDPGDFEDNRGYLANWDKEIVACGGLPECSNLANREFATRILRASQGWPGFEAKLIHATSKLAILNGDSRMHLHHFERVFDRLSLLMKRAGANPFRGNIPRSTEIWLDDESFEIVLERYEEERRHKLNQTSRSARV
jgi:hypothetical protein